jgi:hypothetical protein
LAGLAFGGCGERSRIWRLLRPNFDDPPGASFVTRRRADYDGANYNTTAVRDRTATRGTEG